MAAAEPLGATRLHQKGTWQEVCWLRTWPLFKVIVQITRYKVPGVRIAPLIGCETVVLVKVGASGRLTWRAKSLVC